MLFFSKNWLLTGLFIFACVINYAHGDEVNSKDNPAMDSAVADWLALQRSGLAASPHSQLQTGDEMNHIYMRYLKSFDHELPEYFQHARITNQ